MINYDSLRGGISIETRKGDITTSHLLIQNADETNSGKYSCSPSNAIISSIRVHVLNGEFCPSIKIYQQTISNLLLHLFIVTGEHPEAMHSNSSSVIHQQNLYARAFLIFFVVLSSARSINLTSLVSDKLNR